LATHKSALKRARQNEVRRLRNKGYKTRIKTAINKFRRSLDEGPVDEARKNFSHAVSVIHKSASKGVIHKNKAARKVARLDREANRRLNG